jgi:hypothetical protein
MRHFVMSALLLAALSLGACSHGQRERQPGQAFLDSQIPSGLAPQYYPPDGFVWAGYRADDLPEARYGVASPPLNPHAEVLILADADYPAETYFALSRQLLAAGYGVWLFEPPGQGGAGRYLLQGNTIHTPDYRDAEKAATGLIRDVIHPSPQRPLYVIGGGYSAIEALRLAQHLKGPAYAGFAAFNPYLGGVITPGGLWHREDALPGYWGSIAQNWQMQNPDLRLRMKSERWRKEMGKAFAALNAPRLSLSGKDAPVYLFEPQTADTTQLRAAKSLCAHVAWCQMRTSQGEAAFGGEWLGAVKG